MERGTEREEEKERARDGKRRGGGVNFKTTRMVEVVWRSRGKVGGVQVETTGALIQKDK